MEKKLIRFIDIQIRVTSQSERTTGEVIKALQSFVDTELCFDPNARAELSVEIKPEIL